MSVYFVRCNKRVKIGHSAQVKRRVAALQTGAPDRLVLFRVVDGGLETEGLAHKYFERRRIGGEWFSYSREMTTWNPSMVRPETPDLTPEQIVSLRDKLRLDQSGLAKLIGVSQGAVSRWEDGIRKPRAVALLRLKRLTLRKRKPNGKAKARK